MADYSISKDPTATNLTQSKNSTNRVTISKNPGFTKAYFTKSGGTIVAVGKGDTSGSYGPAAAGVGVDNIQITAAANDTAGVNLLIAAGTDVLLIS